MDSLINKIINLLKPLYIYKVGSSLVCNNPNDIDLVLIYDNKEDMLDASNKHHQLISRDEETINGIKYNLLFNNKEYIRNTAIYYSYEFGPYLVQLYGDDDVMKDFNMLTNLELKKDVCMHINNELIAKVQRNYPFGSYITKPYRLLLTCYILDNNSFELTEEQLLTINQVHDNKSMSDELWDYCKHVIYNILKNEFNKNEGWLIL